MHWRRNTPKECRHLASKLLMLINIGIMELNIQYSDDLNTAHLKSCLEYWASLQFGFQMVVSLDRFYTVTI